MAEKVENDVKEVTKPERAAAAQEGATKPKEQKRVASGPGSQRKEARAPTSIVRLAGKDVNGSLSLRRAMDEVRGIGPNMASALSHAIETRLGIPSSTTLGSLNEQQVAQVESVIKNPAANGVPVYMLNRRKDHETGKDLHLVSNDLIFAGRQDVSRDVALRTWRGFRHQFGQKVRGQHTRSTGRTGTTVGVIKKAEVAKQAPAKAGEAPAKKEEKK